MDKPEYTATELARNWSEISAEAMRRPVTLTRHKKAQFVLMSKHAYDRLRAALDRREAGTLETMPAHLADEIETAIADYGSDD